ncbi:MAG: hypothetical protein Q9200_006399, partial [Gallowayella weberi]
RAVERRRYRHSPHHHHPRHHRRRLLDRAEFSGDDDDDDDIDEEYDELGLPPWDIDDFDDEFDLDDEEDLPSVYSEDRRSYERHRPRHGRRHHHHGGRRHTPLGLGGMMVPRDPRERYAGLMGGQRHHHYGFGRGGMREREWEMLGHRHRFDDGGSLATSETTW